MVVSSHKLKSSYTFPPHPCVWMCCTIGVARLGLVESSTVEIHVCPSRCCWRSKSWVRLKLFSKRLEWSLCRKEQVPEETCKNEMVWLTPQSQGGRSGSSKSDSEQRRALAGGSDGFFFSQLLAGLDTPGYSEHFLATS